MGIPAAPLARRSTPLEKAMSHKFKLRQSVRLTHAGYSDGRSTVATVYEVVRLMPADQTGEVSYRIKSGMVERAVRESEIRSL
jgi:hypothetical protein